MGHAGPKASTAQPSSHDPCIRGHASQQAHVPRVGFTKTLACCREQ